MKKLSKHPRFWTSVVLVAADYVFFSVTNPTKLPSFMIIIGFMLLAATIYKLLRGILTFISIYGIKVNKNSRRLVAIAVLASGVVAMQSIGELSFKDVLVVVPLIGLLYTYMSIEKISLSGPQTKQAPWANQ